MTPRCGEVRSERESGVFLRRRRSLRTHPVFVEREWWHHRMCSHRMCSHRMCCRTISLYERNSPHRGVILWHSMTPLSLYEHRMRSVTHNDTNLSLRTRNAFVERVCVTERHHSLSTKQLTAPWCHSVTHNDTTLSLHMQDFLHMQDWLCLSLQISCMCRESCILRARLIMRDVTTSYVMYEWLMISSRHEHRMCSVTQNDTNL